MSTKQTKTQQLVDYAWPTVADYEKDVGFPVNQAFKMAWNMARTTNSFFNPPGGHNSKEEPAPVPWNPSKEQFTAWCKRHGMQPSKRDAFNDAATLYQLSFASLSTQPSQPTVADEYPSMPETWHVTATVGGERILTIGDNWYSGKGELSNEETSAVVGMAKHLLSFVGYGLPQTSFDPDADDEPTQPEPVQQSLRTDQQIVDQTEELAVWLLGWCFNHQPETDTPMRESTHPFAERCWAAACHIQEMLTATDPENSVAELDVDTTPPAAPRTCTWTPSADPNMPGTYSATCGAVWTFTECGPTDNGVHFCPKCGSNVVESGAHEPL